MTEEDFILHAHDLAMSADYNEAAFGRFLKEVLPVYKRLVEEETRRADYDPELFAHATLISLSSLIAIYASIAAKPGLERMCRATVLKGLQQVEQEVGR